MKESKKISEISEKEIVSILNGDMIITKLDNVFIMIGKSIGISSEKGIVKELDVKCDPCESKDLFNMLSQISPLKLDYQALITREKLSTEFVLV